MLKTNQTLHDFNELMKEVVHEYRSNHLTHGWEFTSFIDKEGSTKYVMVANKIQATKLIFNEDDNCIVQQTIYKSDLDIFNKLRSEL